jgi:hypothetical protein|tara:strand:- start:312 stop:1178 length:867 start_codon:yes stop_codon:yes gene_type:complete
MDQTTEAVVNEQPTQPDETTTTSVLSSDQPVEKPAVDFKSLIPQEYKDERSLQNFSSMDSFVKSYLNANRMVGLEKLAIPNKHSTESDWDQVYQKLGRPETPDEYKYNLPKESKLDSDSLNAFSKQAHKLGLLPQQADGIIQYYQELANSSEIDANSKAETSRIEAEKSLRKEFGPAYKDKINAARHLATNTLGNEFLSNTLLADGSILGNNPTVVRAFADLASKLSEDSLVKGEPSSYLSMSEINKQIAALQQPGSAYWDKHHLNHEAAVQEVHSLIQQKNNEEAVE